MPQSASRGRRLRGQNDSVSSYVRPLRIAPPHGCTSPPLSKREKRRREREIVRRELQHRCAGKSKGDAKVEEMLGSLEWMLPKTVQVLREHIPGHREPVGFGGRVLLENVEPGGLRDWTLSPADMLADLTRYVGRLASSVRWPKTPCTFSNELRRIATELRERGIDVIFGEDATADSSRSTDDEVPIVPGPPVNRMPVKGWTESRFVRLASSQILQISPFSH